jgi:hypothetical protein
MNTEVALVILLDEERSEFSYVGVAQDSAATDKRIREFRFPADKSIAGKVIRPGQPIIVSDTSREPDFYPGVGQKIGYFTRNMLAVPLRGRDRIRTSETFYRSIKTCLMTKHDISRFPVVKSGRVMGTATRSDTMRYLYDLRPE